MLMTPVVNFTNILWGVFLPIFFCQKIAKPNCNYRKSANNTFIQKKAASKMLMKLTPGVNFTNMFKLSFYVHRSQKGIIKMADDLIVIFALHKSCT